MADKTSKLRYKESLLSVLLFIYISILGTFPTITYGKDSSKLSMQHTPVKLSELPSPGQPMSLTVKIPGSSSLDLKVGAYIVRDGQGLYLPSSSVNLNESDEAIYSFELFAPLAELSYQFILYQNQGGVLSTKRFLMRRRCIPNLDLTSLENLPERDGEAKLRALIQQSGELEVMLESYETAIELIEKAKTELK